MSIVEDGPLAIQRQARKLGNIRLGTKGAKGNPVKLDTFRLTSPAKGLIRQAADLYGGTVEAWDNQWEVITDTAELAVYVPPQSVENLSWYELWSAGGLQRRCDGQHLNDGEPCQCDPDNRECAPTTRLAVMLPEIGDIGIWLLTSTGYYAAKELGFTVNLIMKHMFDTGELLPATLTIDKREVKRPGQPAHQYTVPVLQLATRLTELVGIAPPKPTTGALSGESGTATPEVAAPPAPPVPALPAEPPHDIEDADELAPDNDPDLFSLPYELDNLLAEDFTAGTNADIEARTRLLFDKMQRAGLWHEDAFHNVLGKWVTEHADLSQRKSDGPHWGDLARKEHMQAFAAKAKAAAKTALTKAQS